MFFENYNHFIFAPKKVHSFKVFKRSTKFKRYNRGSTKFIFNRKRYALRKKKTTLYAKFTVPLFWSTYFSKKRQLIRFYQCYFMLRYTMSLVNNTTILNLYNSINKKAGLHGSTELSPNTSFISKGIITSSTLFYSKTFLNTFNFFENIKIGFLHSTYLPSATSHLSNTNLISQNFFSTVSPTTYLHNYSLVFMNLTTNFAKLLFFITKTVRIILANLILFLIFK